MRSGGRKSLLSLSVGDTSLASEIMVITALHKQHFATSEKGDSNKIHDPGWERTQMQSCETGSFSDYLAKRASKKRGPLSHTHLGELPFDIFSLFLKCCVHLSKYKASAHLREFCQVTTSRGSITEFGRSISLVLLQ